MTQRQISDFPDGQWRVMAKEAEERGMKLTDGCLSYYNGTEMILIGLIDIVRELTERIDFLEHFSDPTEE